MSKNEGGLYLDRRGLLRAVAAGAFVAQGDAILAHFTRERMSWLPSLRLRAVTWRSFMRTRICTGYPPAESEIAAAMCVSPPSVNQMVKMLEKKGLDPAPAGRAPIGRRCCSGR